MCQCDNTVSITVKMLWNTISIILLRFLKYNPRSSRPSMYLTTMVSLTRTATWSLSKVPGLPLIWHKQSSWRVKIMSKMYFFQCVVIHKKHRRHLHRRVSAPRAQPSALIAEIWEERNDSPLLVKQMERANRTHRITQCKSAIAHYVRIKGYHCRRWAELTFCAATWWFNQLLSFASHPRVCR